MLKQVSMLEKQICLKVDEKLLCVQQVNQPSPPSGEEQLKLNVDLSTLSRELYSEIDMLHQ
jgi:hypothetical protein